MILRYLLSAMSIPVLRRFVLVLGILVFSLSYGIWGISQDVSTRGQGNVGYTGFLTLPLYLTTQARDTALKYYMHTKFQTYGGYIQYGMANNLDVGLHGNSSINSSIGINLKFRPFEYLATLIGFDYIMNEMLLAPFGAIMTGTDITKYFSMYGGLKAFNWSNMILQESPQQKKDVFGTIIFLGAHLFRKEGWKDQKILSSFPTGLYFELAYPVNIDNQCLTIVLGLDGFFGLSFPRIQWR